MRHVTLAVFLACSWFWCIGGFFPVILRQEFGDIAFPYFVTFNVLGAAAFGFVWTEDRRAAFLLRMHAPAQLFSAVVVVFQIWFIVWLSALIDMVWPLALFVAALALTLVFRRREGAVALALLSVTTAIFFYVAANGPAEVLHLRAIEPFTHQILPLAFGFVLAPYFDLTFHDAFRNSPNPRLTFALAFVGIFAAFLAGLQFAAPTLAALLSDSPELTHALAAMIALLAAQTGFTTAVHTARISGALRHHGFLVVGALGIVTVPLAAATIWPDALTVLGVLIYKNFVFVIGGLFPLALLFAASHRTGLAAAVIVTPCYALGFLVGGSFAPALSVAIAVIVAAYAIRRWLPMVSSDATS